MDMSGLKCKADAHTSDSISYFCGKCATLLKKRGKILSDPGGAFWAVSHKADVFPAGVVRGTVGAGGELPYIPAKCIDLRA